MSISMSDISFALVLNLHQPAGNLEYLLQHQPWESREILWAIDRIPRSLWTYEDIARVHLSLSGTLLETLSNPGFQEQVYGVADCGSLLWYLQNQRVIQILGTAYYHPVLPLVPRHDWDAHIERWQGIGRHVFGRERFTGFWPPEMGFCMELIPSLRRSGYQYVLVDSEHVQAVTPMRWDELRYRPHVARFDGEEIIVIVRDRELSDAQLAGMDPAWFIHEVAQRTRYCDFPPLVTVCTDGDNGGWFRNTTPAANFWGTFYQPLLDGIRANQITGIRPAFVDEYLMWHGAHGEVSVRPGAWNTGWHNGTDFTQWAGSAAQQQALGRLRDMSAMIEAASRPEEAYWRLLRSETSCNFFWGDAWVQRCHDDLDTAYGHLDV
jgi:4-alpha-glucanotransferase